MNSDDVAARLTRNLRTPVFYDLYYGVTYPIRFIVRANVTHVVQDILFDLSDLVEEEQDVTLGR